jgi:uncharacterized protein
MKSTLSYKYKFGDFAKIKPRKKIVVLYHNDCTDGFSGAWAAWKKFGPRADYFPAQHNVPLSPHLKNKEVYCIDFTFLGNDLKKLLAHNNVTTLDHHISAKKEIQQAHTFIFNNSKSGATIAWEFFHPQKKAPLLLTYIEDRDLWRWKYPYTKEILTAVDLLPYTWTAWSTIARDLESAKKRKEYKKKGATIITYQARVIKRAEKDARLVKFHGKKAVAVNSTILKSEIGHALYESRAPIAIVWSERNGRIFVSLRSNGSVDVSKLAQKHDGGGHKAAAGFSFPVKNKFPWK